MALSTLTQFPQWRRQLRTLRENEVADYDAVLQVVGDNWSFDGAAESPLDAVFCAAARRRISFGKDLKEHPPLLVTEKSGTAMCRVWWHKSDDAFTRLQYLRRGISALSELAPNTLALDVRMAGADVDTVAAEVLFAALVGAAQLDCPNKKNNNDDKKQQAKIFLFSDGKNRAALNTAAVTANANTLARRLAQLPPNVLTTQAFAKTAQALARQNNLSVKTYTAAQLKKMGAGAICAVGRASTADNAPMVLHIRYRPKTTKSAKNKKPPVALVGKGVCFDTGGVNVKPARYMRGMSKDMAGAACALAGVIAAAQLQLPQAVDAWLALAENAVAANAYRPDEVVTALNGKRIEVVHTDAEGRMILADTLTLASRSKPALIISYATLTGTMHIALDTRMSGFFASDESWHGRAAAAAAASGERLCRFPLAADYKEALKSEVADILQCAEAGEADHIRAALFLREFIASSATLPWLHLDLSSALCKGGLAAVPTDLTGFGVAWTVKLLTSSAQ